MPAVQVGDASPLGAYAAGIAAVSFGVTNTGAPAAIVAANDLGINVFHIHERKCVHSWSTRPGLVFSCPVLQHAATKRFYAVHDGGRTLSSWSYDTVEFDKAARLTAEEPVVALLSAPAAFADDVLVVFSSGRLGRWCPDERRVFLLADGTLHLSAQSSVIASAIVHADATLVRVAVLLASGTRLGYEVYPATRTAAALSAVSLQLPGATAVVAADFDGDSLVLLTSSAHLCRYVGASATMPSLSLALRADAFETLGSGALSAATPRKKGAKAAPSAAAALNVAVCALPGSHALVTFRSGGADQLALWDTQFGTLQAELALPPPADAALAGTAGRILAAFCDDMALIGTAHGGAVLLPVTCPPAATLLGALGKLKVTLPHLTEGDAAALRGGSGDADEEEEKATLQALTRARNDGKAFSKAFFALIDRRLAASAGTAAAAQTQQQQQRKRRVYLSQRFLHDVVQLCLAHGGAFADDVLEYAIESHALSATLEDNLIPSLIERQHLRLLDRCLICVHDIPESQLLAILQNALTGTSDETLAAYAAEREAETGLAAALPGDSPRDAFLYLLISAPRNDIFMDACLRRLDYQQALALLRFLRGMLARHAASLDQSLRGRSCQRLPSLAQTIDWLCMVIDAHFVRIVMSPTAHEVFEELSGLTREHLAVCGAVETLQGQVSGLMALLLQQKSVAVSMGDYAVERIRL